MNSQAQRQSFLASVLRARTQSGGISPDAAAGGALPDPVPLIPGPAVAPGPWAEATGTDVAPEEFRPALPRTDRARSALWAKINALYEGAELFHAKGSAAKSLTCMKEIYVGTVKLSKGSWFLCRPSADKKMWFGRVTELVRHVGADGCDRALVKAAWHRVLETHPGGRVKFKEDQHCPEAVTGPIDRTLHCPIVSLTEATLVTEQGQWYLPDSIVPWPCMVVPHPRAPTVGVALARHWHILRNIDGYPTAF